jgi:CheY-like chemotaxis protein
MLQSEYNVLIVDDDPDVLAVSKLAMRGFKPLDLPIQLYTASSKAEAIELLQRDLSTPIYPGGNFAIALIDVVMETDTAGLELCDYIRNTLNNRFAQLYIRTGQPGVAPERDVINRYDINGYFTKVEATEDKLYTIINSGVRENIFTLTAVYLLDLLNALAAFSDSRDAMFGVLDQAGTTAGARFKFAIFVGDRVTPFDMELGEAQDVRDRLLKMPSIPLGMPGTPFPTEGDRYVVDGQNTLIHVEESAMTSSGGCLVVTKAPVPRTSVELLYKFLRTLAGLWKKAK